MKPARIVALAILVVTGVSCASPAWAAFPGTNGSIAYVMEGPRAGEHLIQSAFLGSEGRLVPDTANLRSTDVDRGGDAFDPAWAADGRSLAFASTRSGRRQIYSIGLYFSRSLVSSCGMEVCPLTSDSAESYEPAWSSDGQSIAFTSTRNGSAQIYKMSATGEAVARLTFDNATDQQPTWSQAGKIAFVSDVTGSPEVYVINAQGGELQQVTQSGVNTGPAWSPDGKELAYASKTATGSQIVITKLAGGEVRRLANSRLESRLPAWSPDATNLLVTRGPDLSGRSHLEVIDAKSGITLSPRRYLGAGEDGDWASLPPAPPHRASAATPGLTAIARPASGTVNVNPGHTLTSTPANKVSPPMNEAQATPASTLTESVEVPVNSTYDVTHGAVKLILSSGATPSMSTAVVTGGRFLLIQHSATMIPTIRLLGRPRGCGRGRASIASRRSRQPHVRGHTKGRYKEVGSDGHASTKSTSWEIRNTCRGTLYRAIEDTLTVTDPHRARPIRVIAGNQYLVRHGRR